MQLLYVAFKDHWTPNGNDWSPIDQETDPGNVTPLVCHSVGWLVSESPDAIKLVSNIDGEPDIADNGFGYFIILKSDIIRRVCLDRAIAPKKGTRHAR